MLAHDRDPGLDDERALAQARREPGALGGVGPARRDAPARAAGGAEGAPHEPAAGGAGEGRRRLREERERLLERRRDALREARRGERRAHLGCEGARVRAPQDGQRGRLGRARAGGGEQRERARRRAPGAALQAGGGVRRAARAREALLGDEHVAGAHERADEPRALARHQRGDVRGRGVAAARAELVLGVEVQHPGARPAQVALAREAGALVQAALAHRGSPAEVPPRARALVGGSAASRSRKAASSPARARATRFSGTPRRSAGVSGAGSAARQRA